MSLVCATENAYRSSEEGAVILFSLVETFAKKILLKAILNTEYLHGVFSVKVSATFLWAQGGDYFHQFWLL